VLDAIPVIPRGICGPWMQHLMVDRLRTSDPTPLSGFGPLPTHLVVPPLGCVITRQRPFLPWGKIWVRLRQIYTY